MKTTTLTIKRPEGHVEVVDVSEKFSQGLTDQMFQQIKKATMEAGRGEALSYEVKNNMTDEDFKRIAEYNKQDRLERAVANHNPREAAKYR